MMAIVRKLERVELEGRSPHTETFCTYAVITDEAGQKWLQVDTYGSSERMLKGKKSQSIRLSPEAIVQLREILSREFR